MTLCHAKRVSKCSFICNFRNTLLLKHVTNRVFFPTFIAHPSIQTSVASVTIPPRQRGGLTKERRHSEKKGAMPPHRPACRILSPPRLPCVPFFVSERGFYSPAQTVPPSRSDERGEFLAAHFPKDLVGTFHQPAEHNPNSVLSD